MVVVVGARLSDNGNGDGNRNGGMRDVDDYGDDKDFDDYGDKDFDDNDDYNH